MEGGVADDDAADGDGQQARDRRQRAGAADLDVDRLDLRRRALGGELVGERPARGRRAEAEAGLVVEPVDLVDDAVDVVAEGGALALDRAVVGDISATPVQVTISGLVTKPRAARRAIAAVWVSAERRRDLAPGVGEEVERAAAVTAGSSWRSEPAAALRGLAKVRPVSAWRAFSASKSAWVM